METIILMTMLAANQPQIVSWEGTQNCPMSQPVQADDLIPARLSRIPALPRVLCHSEGQQSQ